MEKKFYFLSGLPRAGSTLLSSLLSQDPNVHAEGSSVLVDVMWHQYWGLLNPERNNWMDPILNSNLEDRVLNLLKSLPSLYYSDVNKPFVLDKNRGWLSKPNDFLINQYINNEKKILVLVRPIAEIVASFVKIRIENNWPVENLYSNLLENQDVGLLTNCVDDIVVAKENNKGEYLFVSYDEIVCKTRSTLENIYDFFGWPKFVHNLDNITRPFVQKDEVYKLIGLHDVRNKIEKQNYKIELPEKIVKKCKFYDSLIFD
jgi:sulfotransferase